MPNRHHRPPSPKKEMPAFGAPALPAKQRCYRLLLMEAFATPSPAFQNAGTWRGRDMAAMATIVARRTRRLHIAVSSARLSEVQVTRRPGVPMQADSVHRVGGDRRSTSDYALPGGARKKWPRSRGGLAGS